MTTKKLTDYLKQQTPTQSIGKIERARPAFTRVLFKKETEFQETPIGKIAREWRVMSLGELYEFQRGLSYRREDITDEETDIEFITIDYVEKGGGLKRTASRIYLKETKVASSANYRVNDNDLLIAITDMTKGDIIGAPLFIEKTAKTALFSMDLIKLVPRGPIYNKFVYYYLMLPRIRLFMRSVAKGTTVLHLDLNSTKKMKIPVPPIDEQKRIVEILSSVDFAIEKVRLLIDRAERLKRGLMQELLTKGIGHKEFQETPIGKIPKEWTMDTLSRLVVYEKGKKPSKLYKEKTRHDLIPYLKAEYLRGLESPEWCEPTDANVLKVSKNDIIIIWDGSYSGDVFTGFEGALASTMVKIMPITTKLVSRYLYYWLRKYYNVIRSTTVGTGIPHVNRRVFENLLIPLPPRAEQENIAEILSAVDKYLEAHRAKLEYLERIKRGLMEVMLTGKVRVIAEPP